MSRGPRADVLIRCDGGSSIGLGHLKRGLALATSLTQDQRLRILFAGRFADGADALIEAGGHRFAGLEDPEPSWLLRLAEKTAARAVVFDIRTDLPRAALDALRARAVVTVTLDDACERRLAADLAVLPPTGGVETLDWTGFGGEALIGWAWQVLAAKPLPRQAARDAQTGEGGALTLLVTMGGADPAGLTLRAARLLLPLARCIDPIFVIGPAFAQPVQLRTEIRALWPKAEIASKPDSLAPFIARADLALVAYGVTAQELAAAGVPTLYLGLTDDHCHSAEALAATGAGLCLGRHDSIGDAALREAVGALIGDPVRRRAMALAGPRALDGCGASRLAARIAQLIRLRMKSQSD